jgi:hypothetical protein
MGAASSSAGDLGEDAWRLFLRQNHIAATISAIQNNLPSMVSCFFVDEPAV